MHISACELRRSKIVKKLIVFLLLLVSTLYVRDVLGQELSRGDAKPACSSVSALDYNEGVVTMGAERLLKEPQCFDKWFIRVYGFFERGFGQHNWVLSCLGCVDEEPIGLDFEFYRAASERCSPNNDLKKINSDGFKTAGLVALGVVNKGGFRTSYTLSVICVDEIKVFGDYPSEKTARRMKDWYGKVRERY